MHFTVHFRGETTYEDDFSYGLVFIPSPVWMKGSKQLLNLNPERPDLRPGSVARIIEQENIGNMLTGSKEATILIHPIGHGSVKDLVTLQEDLTQMGFTVKVFGELGY